MLTSFTTTATISNEANMSLRRGSLTDHSRHDAHARSTRHQRQHRHNHHGDFRLQTFKSSVSKQGEKLRVNVSGRIFESYKKTLISKEGSIFRRKGIVEYYDKDNKEYFFNRDPRAFEAILVYLQCGILIRPETVSLRNFVEELQFFGFEEKAWSLYKSEDISAPNTEHLKPRSEVGTARYIYNMMEHGDVNIASRVFVGLSCIIIFLSIIVYCVETLPDMKEYKRPLFYLEAACVAWFTLDLVIRFSLSPDKCAFVKGIMNIVDLVSILPFYLDFISEEVGGDYIGFAMLRVFRVARVFRIFKLSRYSKAIFLLIVTVQASVRELLLLLMFIVILVILFAAVIFIFEHNLLDPDNKFKSIPHTFWIVIVTITTVGYGDMVPDTAGGKFVTSILSITGVVVVALPIPIIVNNFTRFYERIMSKHAAEYHFAFEDTKCNHLKEEPNPLITVSQYETSF